MTLDRYVDIDYTIVYFHHGLKTSNKPPLSWLWGLYKVLDRRYKKNLKSLYIVHPTSFIRVVYNFFKPIIRYTIIFRFCTWPKFLLGCSCTLDLQKIPQLWFFVSATCCCIKEYLTKYHKILQKNHNCGFSYPKLRFEPQL